MWPKLSNPEVGGESIHRFAGASLTRAWLEWVLVGVSGLCELKHMGSQILAFQCDREFDLYRRIQWDKETSSLSQNSQLSSIFKIKLRFTNYSNECIFKVANFSLQLPPLHAPHNISVNHKKKCATNTAMSFCTPTKAVVTAIPCTASRE